MSDNQELRRNWRTSWLNSIQEFGDADTQRRLWLNPTNTNPHFSFVECFCSYFDGLALSDGGYTWAVDEGLVGEEEAAAVADFHQIVASYDSPTDDYDHKSILADPRWADVVAAAKQAQASLLILIDDPHERRMLVGS